ncbi:hypothetical protein KSD_43400 [Ktedonobacter sp. SOSP1-85]|nr:hypothetical protein KSD_43400 [Ktedonobacter sp. SOSP1-85]
MVEMTIAWSPPIKKVEISFLGQLSGLISPILDLLGVTSGGREDSEDTALQSKFKFEPFL